MIKRIMNTRVAALALAASALFATPALADEYRGSRGHGSNSGVSFTLSFGDAGFYTSTDGRSWRGRDGRSYYNSRYGQRPWESRRMRLAAIQSCAAEITRQGYRTGFRDVDIDNDYRVRQVGWNDFDIRFTDVEVEGRRRDFDANVSCSVRNNRVVSVSGLPQPGGHHRFGRYPNNGHGYGHDRGRSDHGHRGRGRGHRGS